jgi:hypothetical protein
MTIGADNGKKETTERDNRKREEKNHSRSRGPLGR